MFRDGLAQQVFVVGGMEHDRNRLRVRVHPQYLGKSFPRQGRHVDVEQNEMRLELAHEVRHAKAPPRRSVTRPRSLGSSATGGDRTVARGARVVVDQQTTVYRLSRESLARMEAEDPQLALAFHRFVVRTLADRLAFANREISAFQT